MNITMPLLSQKICSLHTLLLLSISALILSSCATLFTGAYENVVVRSEPPGADVTIDGSYKGVTPVTAALQRDHDHNISVHKKGFSDQTIRVTRDFNSVSLLNLINPICWGVDVATGAFWKFKETDFDLALETSKKQRSSQPAHGSDSESSSSTHAPEN